MNTNRTIAALLMLGATIAAGAQASDLVHDAEYYVLEAQNGERWADDDKAVDQKLAAFREQNGGKRQSGSSNLSGLIRSWWPAPGGSART